MSANVKEDGDRVITMRKLIHHNCNLEHHQTGAGMAMAVVPRVQVCRYLARYSRRCLPCVMRHTLVSEQTDEYDTKSSPQLPWEACNPVIWQCRPGDNGRQAGR